MENPKITESPTLGPWARPSKLTWPEFGDLFDELNMHDLEGRKLLRWPAGDGFAAVTYHLAGNKTADCKDWGEVESLFGLEGSPYWVNVSSWNKPGRPDFELIYEPLANPPAATLYVSGAPEQVNSLRAAFKAAFPLTAGGKVFISWAKNTTKAVAEELRPMIEERIAPASTFFSVHMGPLEHGLATMLDELKSTDAMIALASAQSRESSMQIWEIAAAWGREIPVIVVLVADISRDQLPFPLDQLQTVRLSDLKTLNEWLVNRVFNHLQPGTTHLGLTEDEHRVLIEKATDR